MDPRTQRPSREEIRATVVSALLSTRAGQHDTSALIDEETAIGGGGLEINSLNLVQAMVRIEDALSIIFDDRTVAKTPLYSVGTLVDLVERALTGQGQ
jgi:acyl carrier protein